MESFTVVTNSIEIKNLKNVYNGTIDLCKESDVNLKSDIVVFMDKMVLGKLELFKRWFCLRRLSLVSTIGIIVFLWIRMNVKLNF